MNFTVIKAIFKRDFVSYFANPTGYLFICGFVMLSALAAFWPPEFFNNNLANLDQLSRYLPAILLVFIPAITMSTWAEERRQGTDELLLTMPATDRDVVLGKYLAALAIFTVSLLFSMLSIFLVFAYGLGNPDFGLFVCTFVGYWLVGAAMLAVGMVASFLTRNLTVGFVLGVLFMMPLAAAGVADWLVKDPQTAQLISRWSIAHQFRDFERGVISLGGISYFVSVAVVMLYLCMVLIGRRHWGTGEEGDSRWGHYFARFLCLVAIAGGINYLLSNYDPVRIDATTERINSLSESTKQMLTELAADDDVKPIVVDAYVSPKVPSEYAAHKLNLVGTLREMAARSKGKITTNIYEIETFSEQADTAERSYGIEPQNVQTMSRGRPDEEEIFMGIAVISGLDKVVVPFIDKGIPVEYELVRSVMTVAEAKRKRVGVLTTGIEMFGGFSMQGASDKSQIIVELEKQYEVVQVNPNEPITDTYDVLLAVQPSMLAPEAMTNFIDCVRRGQPVAIFEDPLPALWRGAVPTAEPNRPGGPMAMFGGGQEIPKGDLKPLWDALGVRLMGAGASLFGGQQRIDVILQDFNPYPQYSFVFTNQFVFIDEAQGADGAYQPFNQESEITKGLRQVLFLRPGAILKNDETKHTVQPLARTGELTATIPYFRLQEIESNQSLQLDRQYTHESYIMAVAIEGELENDEVSLKTPPPAGATANEGKPLAKTKIRAIVVPDIDCLADPFFFLRAQGARGDSMSDLDFQNVAFVLNSLDWLAQDDRYIDIRKRSRPHRILDKIAEATETFVKKFQDDQKALEDERNAELEKVRAELTGAVDEIDKRTDIDPRQKQFLLEQTQNRLQARVDKREKQLNATRDSKLRQNQRELEQQVRGVQDRYKFLSLALPPILPILLGLYVFFHRRSREREGVNKRRLRFVNENTPTTT